MSKEKTDYTLIKKGIKIESQKRDRVEILSNKKEYYLGELFKEKILSKMTNEKIESETLQETELLACKKDSEIISEMDIKEINPDQIAESSVSWSVSLSIFSFVILDRIFSLNNSPK